MRKAAGLVVASLAMLLGVAGYLRFTDAGSSQSATECVARMRAPILARTAALPEDAVLRARGARIEHLFYGEEKDVRRVARLFSRGGWQLSVEPQDEIGWGAILVDDPARFRVRADRRIRQLCRAAAANRVQYRSWTMADAGMESHFSPARGGSNAVVEVPQE